MGGVLPAGAADLELQAGGRQAQGPCDLASAYPTSLALASDPAELCSFARVSLSSFRNLFQGKEKSCIAGEGVGPSSTLTFSLMPCGPTGRRSWDERRPGEACCWALPRLGTEFALSGLPVCAESPRTLPTGPLRFHG